jgi:hypothetical protein
MKLHPQRYLLESMLLEIIEPRHRKMALSYRDDLQLKL